jgi:hypothetical protein
MIGPLVRFVVENNYVVRSAGTRMDISTQEYGGRGPVDWQGFKNTHRNIGGHVNVRVQLRSAASYRYIQALFFLIYIYIVFIGICIRRRKKKAI